MIRGPWARAILDAAERSAKGDDSRLTILALQLQDSEYVRARLRAIRPRQMGERPIGPRLPRPSIFSKGI